MQSSKPTKTKAEATGLQAILRVEKDPERAERAIRQLFLHTIKHIDLQERTIVDENNRKWFRFGAYDMGAMISEKVKTL
jgi:hypothetical protein